MWFVVADPEVLGQKPGDDLIFFLPPDRHEELGGNCTHSHYEGMCFGTKDAALDACYEFSADDRKLTPYELTFQIDVEH